MRSILVVHPDRQARYLIDELLTDRLEDVLVTIAGNEQEARERLKLQSEARDPYRLVIAYLNIPAHKQDVRNDADQTGLKFLGTLPELGHALTPSVLICPSFDPKLLSQVQKLSNCGLVIEGTEFEEQLIQASDHALEQTVNIGPMRAKITVTLDLTNRQWNYRIKGEGFVWNDYGALKLDADTITRLIERSKYLPIQDPHWENNLRLIGRELGEHIFGKNLGFFEKVTEAAAEAGGANKKTICFNIEQKVHPAMLEALSVSDGDEFWMLEVPIYRRLIATGQSVMQRSPLFSANGGRKEQFSALIIESPVEGLVELEQERLNLRKLRGVSEEAKWLEENLRQWGAEPVQRLSIDQVPPGESFKSYLQKVLTSREDGWNLVHYAGHCYYDENSGKGYVFLPGRPIEKLDLETFSVWLPQTRFLFLSGCQSSQEGFVFELARHQVPVVLGFRWPIEDNVASEFAREFYNNLFKPGARHSIDCAFLSARQAMRNKNRQNMIWAAPILIMQSLD